MNSYNLHDLFLVSTGRLRPCGFWLQRIRYEFVKFVRGVGGTGEAQWIGPLVGKPFKKVETGLARQAALAPA